MHLLTLSKFYENYTCKQIADHVETMIIYKNTNARFSTNSFSITLLLKFKDYILKVMGGGEVTLAVQPGGVAPTARRCCLLHLIKQIVC